MRSERVVAALEVLPNFTARLEAGDAPLTLHRKSGALRAELVGEKVTGAVQTFSDTRARAQLRRAGLDPKVLTPITLTTLDSGTVAEQASGSLGWLIPFFIVVWTLTGGQMVAIDATAGEKERGTLEALLVTPVRRAEVVVGKFLATLAFGLSAALMAILGFLASGALLGLLFIGRLSGEAGELASSLGGSLSLRGGPVLALAFSALLLRRARGGATHRHHPLCPLAQRGAELRRAAQSGAGIAGGCAAICRLFRRPGALRGACVRYPAPDERPGERRF